MWEKLLREKLRAVFEAFAGLTGQTVTRVSSAAINDPHWLGAQLRADADRGFTIRTYDRVMSWLSDNWPEGAEWPTDVPRPPQSKARKRAKGQR